MQEKSVGRAAERRESLFIVCDDGTAGDISACHDYHIGASVSSVQEEQMQRRVGQHDAEPRAEAEFGKASRFLF